MVKWKGRHLSYWTLMANNDNGQRWFSWGASWTMFCNETHLTFGENIDNRKRNLLVNFPTHPSLTSYKKVLFHFIVCFLTMKRKSSLPIFIKSYLGSLMSVTSNVQTTDVIGICLEIFKEMRNSFGEFHPQTKC